MKKIIGKVADEASNMKKKFSTSTITAENEVVPWLAATGELSYTPEQPPAKDYYFQYGWILPELFSDRADIKLHRYFGRMGKEDARNLFKFWDEARAKKARRLHCHTGNKLSLSVTSPIAVYRHEHYVYKNPELMFIQHGSYQAIDLKDQPEIEKGIVYLYRGIQEAKEFKWLRFVLSSIKAENKNTWDAFLKIQWEVLSDSALSFNSIHDRTSRCETGSINDRTWMTDDIAIEYGLNYNIEGFQKFLWETHHQCFGLEQWVAERKFGPNYVVCKTHLNNIRITTWFAGETECKVIDPNKVEFVETVGCKVKEIGE